MVGGNSSDLSKVKTVQHSRDLKSCSIEVPCTHCYLRTGFMLSSTPK